MIYHKVEPRCSAWFYLRLGKPTASEFSRIVTSGGKPSTQAEDYAHRLIAERMLAHPIDDDVQTQWMRRGQEEEDGAIEAYEFQTGLYTSLGGFCTDDDNRYGCSPDRLVGDDGLLEMKVPAANTHVRYLECSEVLAKEKRGQVQGELLVTGRRWADLVSFHPELPTVIVRVYPDLEYHRLLMAGLTAFCRQLDMMQENLERQYGPFKPIVIPEEHPAPDEPDVPAGEGLDISDDDLEMMFRAGVITPQEK